MIKNFEISQKLYRLIFTSLKIIKDFYKKIIKTKIHVVKSIKIAEAAKIIEKY